MRSTKISFLANSIVCSLVIASIAPIAYSQAAASTVIKSANVSEENFDNLQACMQKADASLNIIYIIDKSDSMKENDEGLARSSMVESTLRILKNAGANLGSGEVSYSYVGFGVEPSTKKWVLLSDDNLESELNKARKLAENNSDKGTDWRAGLEAARNSIAAKQNEKPDDNTCFVALWMTDGQIDLNFGNATGYIDKTGEAFRDICESDDLINWYRDPDNNVSLLAALLSENEKYITGNKPEATQLTMHEKSVLLFESVVKGKSGYGIPQDVVDDFGLSSNTDESGIYSCGNVRNNSNLGYLVKSGNAADLSWQFVDLVAGVTGMQKVAPSDNDSIKVPGAIGKIQIYVKGSESRSLTLLDEDNNNICGLVPCPQSSAKENGTYTVFEVDIPKIGSKSGDWTISLNPQDEYKVYVALDGKFKKVKLQGNYDPSKTEYLEGASINASFEVVGIDNQPLPSDLFESIEICPTSPASLEEDACQASPAAYDFSVSETDKNISAQATLKIPDLDKPFKISSIQAISVKPGLQFAKFFCTGESRCPLKPIPNKSLPSKTTLKINGGNEGTSTVKVIDFVAADIPERAESYKVIGVPVGTSKDSKASIPVEVAEGKVVSIDVYLSNSEIKSKDQGIEGYIVYEVSNGDEKIRVEAPVVFSINQNKNWPFIILAMLAAILVGIGLPYTALLIQARRSAKFIDEEFRYLTVPVKVSKNGQLLSRVESPGSEVATSDDLGSQVSGDQYVAFETPDRKLLSKSTEIESGSKALQIGVANLRVKPVRFDAFAPIHVSLSVSDSVVSSNQGDSANLLLIETTTADQSLNGLVFIYASASIVAPVDKSTFQETNESLEDFNSDGASMSFKSERALADSEFIGNLVITYTGTHNFAKALAKTSELLRGKNFENLNKSMHNLRVDALEKEIQAAAAAAASAGTAAKSAATLATDTTSERSAFTGSAFEDEFEDFIDRSNSDTSAPTQKNDDDEF